ncbi:TPA: hypothetical protein QDB06_000835 [Burkholderia vietnamiensis]|nr:hypothetical protein [Burkholderia vietnamiensis]
MNNILQKLTERKLLSSSKIFLMVAVFVLVFYISFMAGMKIYLHHREQQIALVDAQNALIDKIIQARGEQEHWHLTASADARLGEIDRGIEDVQK